MKYMQFILLACMCVAHVQAQTVSGTVQNQDHEPLPGASVYWIGTTIGVTANAQGIFEITTVGVSDTRLIASYVGHQTDTVRVGDASNISIELTESDAMRSVTVTGERPGVILAKDAPIKTEQITQTELRKAACCDLSGCFETQTTVQPHATNVITNSKELRILGLSGVYNQVLVDGMPMIQGLSYTYGISSIPGTLVDNLHVSKGANSVLQGYESISGQINVDTRDPGTSEDLLLNVYLNSFMEKQFNANIATDLGAGWSNLTAIHTTQPADKHDKDGDNILDLPQTTRYMAYNELAFGDESQLGWNAILSLRFLDEERIGGQTMYDAETDRGSTEVYGQTVNITQPEMWLKSGYRIDANNRIAVGISAFTQDQDSYFGTTKYDADQTSFYSNIQYEYNYGESGNEGVKAGFSMRHMRLEETIAFTDTTLGRTYDGSYLKEENIPGFFAENTLEFLGGDLTWIAGLRADMHNVFGTTVTPRSLLKYNVDENTTVRANIGTGWRTANIFSENIGLLVSSRNIVFAEELKPERSLNYGVNIVHQFDSEDGDITGYVSADAYRTEFSNQIFPDYDADPTRAIIQNFTGTSVSNSLQAEVYVKLWKQLELKSGYSYLDVYREVRGEKIELPFNPTHKFMQSVSYKPEDANFHVDANVHWFGKQRLPHTHAIPEGMRLPSESESYAVVNMQFTYMFDAFDIYTGCENLFDFRQEKPILSWQDPFGPYFDSAHAWGPTKGREFYMGLRYRLGE